MTSGIHLKREMPPEEAVERPQPRTWWVGAVPIELRLTANAGVLMTFQGEKLLVDGLHASRAHDFSPVSAGVLDAAAAGTPPWDGIRWMFYTHLHIDHFSGCETRRVMERGRVERLFLPAGNDGPGIDGADVAYLRKWLTETAAPVQELRLAEYRPVCYPLAPGLRVTAFRSIHAAGEYEAVEHACFLFELGGRTVLFLGDSDYDKEYFAAVLAGRKIDAAVVNPLFVTNAAGRAVVTEGVRPDRLVINHIPFAADDRLHMRKLVAHVLARWGDRLPPAAVLWDEGDTVRL